MFFGVNVAATVEEFYEFAFVVGDGDA